MKSILIGLITFFSITLYASANPELKSTAFIFRYDQNMHSTIISLLQNSKSLMNNYFPSEQLIISGDTISDFKLIDYKEFSGDEEAGLELTGDLF